MSVEQVSAAVNEVIARCLHLEAQVLTGETTWADVKADSLARIEITLALEDTFHIVIPDEAAVTFAKLADVVAYIHARASIAPSTLSAAS